MKIETKAYLTYLDKEMTIMGVLSAISVAAPAAVLNVMFGEQNDAKRSLWISVPHFLIVGSILAIVASLYFYKQRSLLAWFYGQICLTSAVEGGPVANEELRQLLIDADSWATWGPYSWGFTLLLAALAEYVCALLFYRFSGFLMAKAVIFILCLSIVAVVAAFQRYVLTHPAYKFSEEPWSDFFDHVRVSLSRSWLEKLHE